jgi:hypothetical protein
VLETLLHPGGFVHDWTSRELLTLVLARHHLAADDYRLSQLRYDLSKLRAKGLVEHIAKTRRYCLTPLGLKLGVLLVKLRRRLLGPLTSLIHQPTTTGTGASVALGKARFEAWIETLPQASQPVPLTVSPGDSVTVSIDEQDAGSGNWQISMSNNTTGQRYLTNVTYTSSESSAEWIEEAPTGVSGVLPLDNFQSVDFSSATTTANGQTLNLAQAGAQALSMVNDNNDALAEPSALGSGGADFTVTRTSAPATWDTGGPGDSSGGSQPGTPAP